MAELEARGARNAARSPDPTAPAGTGMYRFGRFELRLASRELLADGTPVPLGGRAFDVLHALLERRDRIVSKAELLDVAWPGVIVEENNLQVQVSTLRKILGASAIATIPGRGYRFTAALREAAPSTASSAAVAPSGWGPFEDTLIGRSAELVQLRQWVERHRLVTIAGAGGMGKTRLASEVYRRLEEEGVAAAWVELAPVADPAAVPYAIADALGVRVADSAAPVDALASALAGKDLLLVIDNAEHVPDAVAVVVDAVLRAAPDVRVLVTSRAPLKLPVESTYRLEGLAVPEHVVNAKVALEFGAVALFRVRALAASRRFTLTDANAPIVAEICRRVDGMPLAIEFAAARVASLGLGAIAEQLSQKLGALSAAHSTVSPRHRTLNATLDWSYNLLALDEQALFRRLGVFSGGFFLEGARAVSEGLANDDWEAGELLSGLVEKSVVVMDAEDPPRYSLLESARTYALEKLEASDDAGRTRRRHAQFFTAMLERIYDAWFVEAESESLTQARRELDNVSAAMAWALGPEGDAALAIELASVLLPIFIGGGRRRRAEARKVIGDALALVDPSTPTRTTARLCVAKGMLFRLLDRVASQQSFERAIGLLRATDNSGGLAHALIEYSRALTGSGDSRHAEEVLDEALAVARTIHAPILLGLVSMNRGYIRMMDAQPEAAVAEFERCLEQFESAGAATRALQALSDVADARWACGQLDEAERTFREIIRRRHRTHDSGAIGVPLLNLVGVLVEKGQLEEALAVARDAFEVSDQRWTAFSAMTLRHARLSAYAVAARLHGCCLAAYEAADHRIEPNEARLSEKALAILRDRLPPPDLEALVAAGRQMSEEAACALALSS